MYIVIDTEFTSLTRGAELLSLGAVSEDGRRFYCELEPVPLAACSDFVRRFVLPLREGGAAVCTRPEFPARLAGWLGQFADPVLLVDSDWDIDVLHHALTGRRSRLPGPLRFTAGKAAHEVMLMTLAPFADEELAVFERAVHQHFATDPRQHHALVDALAIAAGLQAVSATRPG
jgi:hypothetical protein